MTLQELAEKLGATLEGDGSPEITGLAALKEAGPGDLSFLSNPRYAADVAATRATGVLVKRDWSGATAAALLRVDNADRSFALAATLLGPPAVRWPAGIHESAVIGPGVELADDVYIGPCCVLEPGVRVGARTVLVAGCYLGHGATVGADCLIYPNVTMRERTVVGSRVIIHNGAVVGSDGFGYVREGVAWRKVPQIGHVEIGDDVEIGANATIDRARFGRTVIEDGVKIDNLVQVAHNVRIGAHTAIAAQVGISGSTRIGQGVQLGGQAGLAGHLEVGNHAVVGAQAGVTKDVPPATFVSGYPAMPHNEARRVHAHIMRIPELKERLAAVEEKLRALESARNGKDA